MQEVSARRTNGARVTLRLRRTANPGILIKGRSSACFERRPPPAISPRQVARVPVARSSSRSIHTSPTETGRSCTTDQQATDPHYSAFSSSTRGAWDAASKRIAIRQSRPAAALPSSRRKRPQGARSDILRDEIINRRGRPTARVSSRHERA